MNKVTAPNNQHLKTSPSIDGVRVGKVINIDENGQPFVDFSGNYQGPLVARYTNSITISQLREAASSNKDVLLAFDNNDSSLPIIIDTLFSLLDEISEPASITRKQEEIDEVMIDGNKVTLNAREEIVLRCGKASITLTRAGKIIIRGAYLLNRSSGVNRIKGGSVQIN